MADSTRELHERLGELAGASIHGLHEMAHDQLGICCEVVTIIATRHEGKLMIAQAASMDRPVVKRMFEGGYRAFLEEPHGNATRHPGGHNQWPLKTDSPERN